MTSLFNRRKNKMLTSENVERIFFDCLFLDNEPHTEYVEVEGITTNVGFNPKRLLENSNEIIEMLSELPDEFNINKGGGWSFLNACNTKDGIQWTGSHSTMEKLFQLGVGIGVVNCLMPREIWQLLPGGLPYYSFSDTVKPTMKITRGRRS
jgi:hypothetical protein